MRLLKVRAAARRRRMLAGQMHLVAAELAAHVRAGRTLSQAVGDVADELPEPAAGALREVDAALVLGMPPAEAFALLHDYGIPVTRARSADSAAGALAAAAEIGYPVVVKTAEPDVAHKSDAGGVVLAVRDPAGLEAAYAGLAARLGPRVLVGELAGPGTELSVGIVADPDLGPLIVVGAGGVLVEHLADRVVALPPVDDGQARRMLSRLRVAPLLAGFRGRPPADLGAVAATVTGVSAIARELGGALAALDINPVICGPAGVVAVDVLVEPIAPPASRSLPAGR